MNQTFHSSQCSWAVDGWKKIWQLCWLKTNFYTLLKGQNEPKMKMFQPAIFVIFWFYDINLMSEGLYWEVIWRLCEFKLHIWTIYFWINYWHHKFSFKTNYNDMWIIWSAPASKKWSKRDQKGTILVLWRHILASVAL